MKQQVNIKKLDDRAIIPTYGTAFSAGADLYACMDHAVTIAPGETYLVHTGISAAIPEGYAGLIYARSGLATKKGLAPAKWKSQPSVLSVYRIYSRFPKTSSL